MIQVSEFVELPADLWESRDDAVVVEEKRVKVKVLDGKEVEVYYQEGVPASGATKSVPVLLLHGMRFKSQTWRDLGTINLLAKMGHRVVAVDLPGYGETPAVAFMENWNEFLMSFAEGYGNTAKAEIENLGGFLFDFVSAISLDRPVIVSPSMSGSFSLPYLMAKPAQANTRCRGYVPVAPVATKYYKKEQYEQVQIPALILSGSKDTAMGDPAYDDLRHIPGSVRYVMDDCGHPCYLDRPAEWHKIIYNVMNKIQSL